MPRSKINSAAAEELKNALAFIFILPSLRLWPQYVRRDLWLLVVRSQYLSLWMRPSCYSVRSTSKNSDGFYSRARVWGNVEGNNNRLSMRLPPDLINCRDRNKDLVTLAVGTLDRPTSNCSMSLAAFRTAANILDVITPAFPCGGWWWIMNAIRGGFIRYYTILLRQLNAHFK